MDPLHHILRKATRRIVLLRSASAAAVVICIVLAALIALVLLGVDIAGWRWLWLVSLAAVICASIWVARCVPKPYVLAQRLDRACDLHDTLATASYVIENRIETRSARFLLDRAGAAANAVDLKRAIPARWSHAFTALAIAFGLFCGSLGIRYATVGSLDLHPSCITLWASNVKPADAAAAPQTKAARRPAAHRAMQDGPAGLDANRSPDSQSKQAGEGAGGQGALQRLQKALSQMFDHSGFNSQKGSQSQQEEQAGSEEKGEQGKRGAGGQTARSRRTADRQGEKSSGQGQTGTAAQARAQQNSGSQGAGQKSDGNAESAQSGAGSDNGSKRVLNAQELKAIGRIEKLMNQQAAQVSGDMSIVKATGPQQLSTPFSNAEAVGGSSDTTVMNQPIPAQDREYVRKYMDALHRLTDAHPK